MITEDNTPVETTNEGDTTIHTVNNLPTNRTVVSPYLQCNIEGETIQLLVDTGATVSVLAKEVVDLLIKRNPRIQVLPVNGIQISNAVGKKICKVSKQIYCECQIDKTIIFANFIQIENLNERGIIGTDVLNQYNAKIDFNKKIILLYVDNEEYIIPFAERIPKEIKEGEKMQNIAMEDEPVTDVELANGEKIIFNNLMYKYSHLFSENPGRIEQYECQIKISPGEPVYQRPYPIPMSKLTRMDKEIQRMLDLGIIEGMSNEHR